MHFNPISVLKHSLKLSYLALICALSACGGSADDEARPSSPIATSSQSSSAYKDMCANPRTGLDPFNNNRPYPDKAGSLQNEKDWLRAWVDETYLWYREVPKNLNPSHYATAIDYFNALKTPAFSTSGNPKDKYHFTENTAEFNKRFQSGIRIGYGMELSYISNSPPRKFIVTYTDPGSPAERMGIRRGMEIESIDGIDFININDASKLYEALFYAQVGQSHLFTFRNENGQKISKSLSAVEVQSSPVLNKKIIETAKGRVGYLTFNSHDYLAEQQLISAISQFRDSNIQDLVLDLRYNGGGLLDVASELAYMIAGPTQTNGKIFEKTIQNDKQTISQSDIAPFYSNSRFSSAPSALPYLGLKQVTILTSNDTCSASEAIINGLRGIDVKVNLIGAQTCGKPTGFYPTDNCGTTYFSVQFTGVNHKGFGDYPDGFAPTCPVADDYSKELGDPLEKRLAVGLSYIANGQCPASGQSQGPAPRDGKLYRSPLDAIKIINRPK